VVLFSPPSSPFYLREFTLPIFEYTVYFSRFYTQVEKIKEIDMERTNISLKWERILTNIPHLPSKLSLTHTIPFGKELNRGGLKKREIS